MGSATAAPPEATEGAVELAKEAGIDLANVKGSGTEGRIVVKDVEAVVAKSEGEEKSASKAKKGSKKTDADLMPDRAHAEGCPKPDGRIEVYEATVPAKTDSNGQVVKGSRKATIAHCVECGGSTEVGRV